MEWVSQNAGMLIGIALTIINIGVWIWDKFNKLYKLKKSNEDFHETVENHTKQITEMDTRHKEDYCKLDSKLDGLSDVLGKFISISKRSNQVILRDKIYMIYKDTLRKGYILEKDSKNIHDMIDCYKEQGGNSFVCDEIVPRLMDFKIFISDADAEEYFKSK